MCNRNGHIQKIRGSVLMLIVDPSITAQEILQQAVDKHCSCNWQLSRSDKYSLLYPDGKPVQYIPGTTEPFVLAAYKSFMGLPYQKLVLFICAENDMIAGNYVYLCFTLHSSPHFPPHSVLCTLVILICIFPWALSGQSDCYTCPVCLFSVSPCS